MAYNQFPAYAQLVLEDDYEPQASGGVERTEMDDGFVEQVPIQSLARYELALSYRLFSQADKDAFEDWRRKDLRLGTAFFAWPDPEDPNGTVRRRARIVGGSVAYRALTNRFDDYLATFTVEYWR